MKNGFDFPFVITVFLYGHSRHSHHFRSHHFRPYWSCVLTCMVVTSVHLPCLSTVSTQSTDVLRAVKGEAMDASPSFTMVGSISCAWTSAMARANLSFALVPMIMKRVLSLDVKLYSMRKIYITDRILCSHNEDNPHPRPSPPSVFSPLRQVITEGCGVQLIPDRKIVLSGLTRGMSDKGAYCCGHNYTPNFSIFSFK